jgi:hypothetical protein
MAATSFQDFNLADADREWDGDAADNGYVSGPTLKTHPTGSIATLMLGTTPTTRTTSLRTNSSFAM